MRSDRFVDRFLEAWRKRSSERLERFGFSLWTSDSYYAVLFSGQVCSNVLLKTRGRTLSTQFLKQKRFKTLKSLSKFDFEVLGNVKNGFEKISQLFAKGWRMVRAVFWNDFVDSWIVSRIQTDFEKTEKVSSSSFYPWELATIIFWNDWRLQHKNVSINNLLKHRNFIKFSLSVLVLRAYVFFIKSPLSAQQV